jgi:hypothetical protein
MLPRALAPCCRAPGACSCHTCCKCPITHTLSACVGVHSRARPSFPCPAPPLPCRRPRSAGCGPRQWHAALMCLSPDVPPPLISHACRQALPHPCSAPACRVGAGRGGHPAGAPAHSGVRGGPPPVLCLVVRCFWPALPCLFYIIPSPQALRAARRAPRRAAQRRRGGAGRRAAAPLPLQLRSTRTTHYNRGLAARRLLRRPRPAPAALHRPRACPHNRARRPLPMTTLPCAQRRANSE